PRNSQYSDRNRIARRAALIRQVDDRWQNVPKMFSGGELGRCYLAVALDDPAPISFANGMHLRAPPVALLASNIRNLRPQPLAKPQASPQRLRERFGSPPSPSPTPGGRAWHSCADSAVCPPGANPRSESDVRC